MGEGKMGGVGEQKWEVSHTILIFKRMFPVLSILFPSSFFSCPCLSPCSLVWSSCFCLGGWHQYSPAQSSAFRVAGSCLSVIVLDLESVLGVLDQPWRVLNLKGSGKIPGFFPGS